MSDWKETVLNVEQLRGIGLDIPQSLKDARIICEAQAKETWPVAQQQLLEWLEGSCEHERPKFSGNCDRWDCPQCMQEIRKALGMEVKQ